MCSKSKRQNNFPTCTCNSWMVLCKLSIVLPFWCSLLSFSTVSLSVCTFQHLIFSTSSNSLEKSSTELQFLWVNIYNKKEINQHIWEQTFSIAPLYLWNYTYFIHSEFITSSFSNGGITFILGKPSKWRHIIQFIFTYLTLYLCRWCLPGFVDLVCALPLKLLKPWKILNYYMWNVIKYSRVTAQSVFFPVYNII